MAITKEQAIDILEKFDFFQGQRAGRELWNSKPKEVQDEDIFNFSKDVALLKEYIADVVPRSEVEELKKRLERTSIAYAEMKQLYEQAKQEVAKQIFEEIEREFSPVCAYEGYAIKEYLADLKKKYIGD